MFGESRTGDSADSSLFLPLGVVGRAGKSVAFAFTVLVPILLFRFEAGGEGGACTVVARTGDAVLARCDFIFTLSSASSAFEGEPVQNTSSASPSSMDSIRASSRLSSSPTRRLFRPNSSFRPPEPKVESSSPPSVGVVSGPDADARERGELRVLRGETCCEPADAVEPLRKCRVPLFAVRCTVRGGVSREAVEAERLTPRFVVGRVSSAEETSITRDESRIVAFAIAT